jgi:para-nitrobenzyl esterase
MPSAAGLFHRASVQSGGGGNPPSSDQSREYARQVLAELGTKDIATLQKIEWAKLNSAANAAAQKVNGPAGRNLGLGSPAPRTPRVGGGPTMDGKIIPVRSYYESAPDISKNIPVLIGGVSEEGMNMSSKPTEDQWHQRLAQTIGAEKATALIAAMKKAHPEKSIATLSYGVSGLQMRNRVNQMAKLKWDQKGAPVFTYFFTWQSPMLEDAGAWHTAELAFCFDNTKRCEQATGNTQEAQSLANTMATAWATFAKSGNPSHPGLTWTPFEPEKCPTMVFDNKCRMENDPEGEARRILST